MTLKMKPEHYKNIAEALDAIADKIKAARPKYAAAGLSDMRLRWDSFAAAKINGDSVNWQCKVLYPYLNDKHVDSALRHYFEHRT